MTADQFVAAARVYLDTPWQHQGRSRDGMDCAGLLLAAAGDCGIVVPENLDYADLPDLSLFDSLLPAFCTPIRAPEVGAVLRFIVAGRPQHLGIVGSYPLGGWSVVHAYMSASKVCEHRLDPRWTRRIVSCWRVKGIG